LKRRDSHHLGLQEDLETLARMKERRMLLKLLAGVSLAPLIGCGPLEPGETATEGTCSKIPAETEGPYPGDGSNGANALALSAIVRSDLRSSIAGATGYADGVVLTVKLSLVSLANACAPLAGQAVYLWHCDREGRYSMYNLPDQNYLRGVQETGADGVATFVTTFPGCYSGRMPHLHFEVYPTLASTSSSRNKVATSQLAFPNEVANAAYAQPGYEASVGNFSRISFALDNVFRDGTSLQMATLTGSVAAGYTASLVVGV
jgi:protocatechuate 3,4-dioxygenase beta subunit